MTEEPPRPIFWFLWPPAQAPLDHDYRQTRLIRIPPRGPWRLILLVGAALVCIILGGVSIMAAIGAGIFPVVLAGAVLASAVVILLRGWSIGAYVNDDGFAIRRLLRSESGRWSSVDRIDRDLNRVTLRMKDGTAIKTGIAEHSLDTWLRPEAYDAAAIQIENWARLN